MKGRAICPKCKTELVLDIPEYDKTHEIACPKCEHKFSVRAKCERKPGSDECFWEEHGEPRKTILSSLTTYSNKPLFSVILLVCVFSIGVTTAVFTDAFIETTFDAASAIGLSGTVILHISDQSNNTLNDLNVVYNDLTFETKEDGAYLLKNVTLGIQTIVITGEGYKKQETEILTIPIFTLEKNIKMENGTGNSDKIRFDTVGCTLIIGIFSVFALLAMIACIKRQHFDLAMGGSFIAILSIGFYFIGSILSLIAFIIIILSRDEFKNGKKGKIF